MTQGTLDLLHKGYQQALSKAENIMQLVECLYQQLKDAEVPEEDSKAFDNFIDGLRGCREYRRMTFEITNTIIYINIVFMYIVCWVNNSQDKDIDIKWFARRKALESDLTKILEKSCSDNPNASASIRDRFGMRGVIQNEQNSVDLVYSVYEAIRGIIANQSRAMRRDFIEWVENQYSRNNISFLDKALIDAVLHIPFFIECEKDYIKNPKENGYQSLHFTMTITMYSKVLPGTQLEVQLRDTQMDTDAEDGRASHVNYKNQISESIHNVFTVDDFSKVRSKDFTGYNSIANDGDGIHFEKTLSNRRISPTL